MEINYTDLVDENLVDECEQIRNIAKKSWLSGAAVSLAHLENVKTNVYNFGISDTRDLKATNLRSRKPERPLSATSSQHNNSAWGSNSSIPDLLRQQNVEKAPLPKPTRPASAKYSNNTRLRPPSGKKPRPQSAKESTADVVSEETQPGFGVKGARYDPSGRPPKGVPNLTTTGWVGPPAGLKYPDKPSPGSGWKIDFPVEPEEEGGGDFIEAEREVPPPPCTTPIPSTPEPNKPKRVFELYIGDPYKVPGQEDEDLYENSDDELAYIQDHTNYNDADTTESSANQSGSHSHYPDNSAPSTGLAEGKEYMRLDLPIADDDYDDIDEVDTDRLLAEAESVSEKLDLKRIININKNIPVTSSHSAEPVNDKKTEHIELMSDDGSGVPNRRRAENLVNTIISETGLAFGASNNRVEKSKKPFLEHEKSSVKFKDDVTTVNITPRNIGRKVDEIHSKKKMVATKDSGFIDLIEVKNRMEPVLSTNKIDMSSGMSRPPSGKSKTGKPAVSAGLGGVGKHTDIRTDTPASPKTCLRNHTIPPRPKSGEPLNRAAKPVTTVTVDYGEEETKDQPAKPKKKRKKSDDVVTMMEKINLQDIDNVVNLQDFEGFNDVTLDGLLETRCKSEPEKNYYEVSRHSSMSNVSMKDEADKRILKNAVPSAPVNNVVKTTKTIEFDEVKPKEITVKSVLDAHAVNKETKEYKAKPPSRPTSAKPPQKKPVKADEPPTTPERPGSRLGFVAMAPSGNKENQHKNKPWSRPSSASLHRRPVSANKSKSERSSKKAGQQGLSEEEKVEREKVIDNLLERTKGLLDGGEKTQETANTAPVVESVEKKKVRPASAHVGIVSRAKEHNHVRSAVNRRPASATTARNNHKHYHQSHSGVSGSRKSSAKSKTIYTEPCIITTNTPYLDEESETEEDLACQEMHKQLKEKGVNIAPDTLQRALYPPSGRTKYYHISADLPQKSSVALLSHPREWLGEEYKRLQKAEKTLARANEIMFLQERAEKRRAMLEALSPEERKKLLKKKGKKGVKKLRKSKTIA